MADFSFNKVYDDLYDERKWNRESYLLYISCLTRGITIPCSAYSDNADTRTFTFEVENENCTYTYTTPSGVTRTLVLPEREVETIMHNAANVDRDGEFSENIACFYPVVTYPIISPPH